MITVDKDKTTNFEFRLDLHHASDTSSRLYINIHNIYDIHYIHIELPIEVLKKLSSRVKPVSNR